MGCEKNITVSDYVINIESNTITHSKTQTKPTLESE